jgi:hypothetical protein
MVLVGYQGWFRCPGDGAKDNSWSHWSKGAPTPETMAIDLLPDTSELDKASLCLLPSATVNGTPAYVFSSFPQTTTDKHFEWMKKYDIDGVLLQRFINHIPEQLKDGDMVLKNVRSSAEKYDRVFAVEYDLSGAHSANVLQLLEDDWQYMEKSGIPDSPAYMRLNGKPVVSLWGLGFKSNHVGDAQLATQIIEWFHDVKHVAVIGGVPTGWHDLSGDSSTDPAWYKVYAMLDIVQPWTVGRYHNLDSVDEWKTSKLVPDVKLTEKNHQLYMPVIFPGFSWHNLKNQSPKNEIPRLGGQFLWQQAYNARKAGAPMVKIAMFDEVNEGTAIFKAVAHKDQAPQPGYWLTLDADGDDLPTDWYLQIAQQISLMFRDTRKPVEKLPLKRSRR